jgi:hypothetical protein
MLIIYNCQIDFKVFKLLMAYNYIMFFKQDNTKEYTHKPTAINL